MIWTLLVLAAIAGAQAHEPAEWVTYTPSVTPDRAGPPWRVHGAGGALEEGVLRLNPTGGYYIDDQPQFFDGSRNTVVEARLCVLERDKEATDNHSTAEIWVGGPQPNTSCVLYLRENAVSFHANYQPSIKIKATDMHTYRIWRDVPNKKAYLFLNNHAIPVLVCNLDAPHGHNINRILFGDSGGAADVSGVSEWAFVRWGYVDKIGPNPKDEVSNKVTLVAFGDSTTAPRGPLEVYPRLLEAELERLGIPARVINAGVGGNTTALARERFQKDVLAHTPELTIISFGINDAAIDVWKDATTPRVPIEEYEANLRHFIEKLRTIGSKTVLFTPNPLAWTPELKEMYGKPPYDPETNAGFNFMLERYTDTMRRVAAAENMPLVDMRKEFKERAERVGIERLLLDGMHPNDVAHRLIADRLLEYIVPLLANDDAAKE
ncbi:MAG: GDSL-type esterase/lipase family protein [Candidatus Hydrogenedentota bacterium]